MSQPESHPIRNGVVATVIGGLILAAILAVLGYLWAPAGSAFSFLWAIVVAVVRWLAGNHAIHGWLLLVLVCGSAALVVSRTLAFLHNIARTPPYASYTSDALFGAVWHWSWSGIQIIHLWASCPICQAELVQLNERDNYLMSTPHAKFYCEHCREVRVDIPGGGHQYALSVVEREIRRKLRVSREPASGVAS